MPEEIPPTPEALEEALTLSDDILRDIELATAPLASAVLKTGRLARLNDFEAQQIFQYEASGYPTTPSGLKSDIWRLAKLAGRTFQELDLKTKEPKDRAFLEPIEQLEHQIEGSKLGLQAAQDRDVSVSSANPGQYVLPPMSNSAERGALHRQLQKASRHLANRRSFIYDYVLRRHYELKFSGAAQDFFSAIRENVDRRVGELVPQAVQQLASVHDNLQSENPEDWSNAVHSCRRILQALADAVFPSREEPRVKEGGQPIKLGRDNYINRLVCFAEDASRSERFCDIVGSHLAFLGDRLDAVFRAAQKGSHGAVSREEANRYVVYTYMLVGDIVALRS